MTLDISIHALREEGDPESAAKPKPARNFYPRPPRGGRPVLTLLGGGNLYFYPRPPRGGRQGRGGALRSNEIFLSTPSARRATRVLAEGSCYTEEISIHALREEGDLPLRPLP